MVIRWLQRLDNQYAVNYAFDTDYGFNTTFMTESFFEFELDLFSSTGKATANKMTAKAVGINNIQITR